MKQLIFAFITLCISACRQQARQVSASPAGTSDRSITVKSYKEVTENIIIQRKMFAAQTRPSGILTSQNKDAVTKFWISSISNDLYANWQHTPWDFNGTAAKPGAGPIACGYFVATILRDMDCRVNRFRLGVLPSSGIMKAVAPHQKIRNLSSLTYAGFADSLKQSGKGVYIVGLDFHVGLIVNDGATCWFIHSNYIRKKGVSKEPVLTSAALRSSKTRWLISLTGDTDFINKWLKG